MFNTNNYLKVSVLTVTGASLSEPYIDGRALACPGGHPYICFRSNAVLNSNIRKHVVWKRKMRKLTSHFPCGASLPILAGSVLNLLQDKNKFACNK